MIEKLLIANRGEIVCRIARTAHAMGISTVGVFSEPDANALHVDVVDTAVALGGSSPSESYLRADAIIAAAVASNADAVHPGYGFLSESADFAEAVLEAGLIWVGPRPSQMRRLGDKIEAKAVAVTAGVPTTPITEVVPGRAPAGLTMPVLVKAAAGGGGRGMRIVRNHIDIADAIEAASREAEAAFGDGTVFIEPYIERGRHVEVQLIGDSFGSVIHLGDRECSIQRRNQKIVEEAPSPGLSDDARRHVIDGALALARHVGYEGAGTVEFMVGDDDSINFLEMNTRLQVEHPVTEAVAGVDLVELQLRVAAGERLPITQDDVSITGHAIEVRLVAENPSKDWLPSTGTIAWFDVGADVRVETGVRSGSTITADYDSMIAKVISSAPTREHAARVLARALRSSTVAGVPSNLDTLIAILGEPDFLRGTTFTSYLKDHPEVLAPTTMPVHAQRALLMGATFLLEESMRRANQATGFAPSGWRNLRIRGQRRTWVSNNVEYPVEYIVSGESASVLLGPWPEPLDDGTLPEDERTSHQLRMHRRDDSSLAIEFDGIRTVVRATIDHAVHAASALGSASFELAPVFVDHDVEQRGGGPISPLPGTVIAIHVAEGDDVVEGQLLMVVEAMKMEHKIVAASDSIVTKVLYGVGARVEAGELLVELAPPEARG